MTMVEKRGDYRHLNITYVGDGNNVANSWIEAACKLGLKLSIACPEGFEPDGTIMARAKAEGAAHIRFCADPVEAVRDSDIINTDTWISMGQDEGMIRQKQALFNKYQVNSALLQAAKKDVLVMHCLPAHRGEEITDEVADGSHAVIFDQAENRLHMQKAILACFLTHTA
jgi:ornithine carbamoyltransferase